MSKLNMNMRLKSDNKNTKYTQKASGVKETTFQIHLNYYDEKMW